MEITSFVLGMLTIAAIIILIATVVCMVKINKQEKQTESLKQICAAIEGDLRREIENSYNNMSREDEEIRRIVVDTNRELTMVEKTIMQEFSKQFEDINRQIVNEIQFLHKHEEDIQRNLHQEIDETKRYIDSRIDKVVLKGTEPGSKQILKG
jgi:hypothetical protein